MTKVKVIQIFRPIDKLDEILYELKKSQESLNDTLSKIYEYENLVNQNKEVVR